MRYFKVAFPHSSRRPVRSDTSTLANVCSIIDMADTKCNFRVPSDLDGLEQLPTDDLARLVQQCDNICGIVAGFGNPDLFGIGVRKASSLNIHMPMIS